MFLLKTGLWALMVVAAAAAAAQLKCDPQTQYEQDGQCCKKCGPGTSMSDIGTCQNPQCKECEDNEYQDKYTRDQKCQRQPYCDPNKNFEVHSDQNKKARNTCQCKMGFHCSSNLCITCVKHTLCEPGHKATFPGNATRDSECEKCPEGTFSNISSLNSNCQEWTKCVDGYYISKKGTAQSDNICEEHKRIHIAVITSLGLVIMIAIVGLLYWRCKENIKDNIKGCVESCPGEGQNKILGETYRPIPTDKVQIEPTSFHEQFSTQEEGSTQEGQGMTPEENVDEGSVSLCPRTENGNYVTQERGKSDILSRQESQTQTFTESSSTM